MWLIAEQGGLIIKGLRTFGPFELDLDHRELHREGRRISLTAKPFDTLAFLVENAGQIVNRDQLRGEVWAGLSVSDPAVEHAVSTVRRALEEDLADPKFIKTIWGQGYIFTGDVVSPAVGAPKAVLPDPHDSTDLAAEASSAPASVSQPTDAYRVTAAFGGHAVQAIFASLMYALLFAVALAVETAYAFGIYGRMAMRAMPVVFVWMASTASAALLANAYLAGRGKRGGSTVSISAVLLSAATLFLALGRFLPDSAITLFTFQGYTARAAYLKSTGYFCVLGIVLVIMPFHYVVRHQRACGRHSLAEGRVSTIRPRPGFLLALLIGAGIWSLLSGSYLFEHLRPGPYMGLYMNLLQLERLVAFSLGFECLAWYYLALKRLERGTTSDAGSGPDGPS